MKLMPARGADPFYFDRFAHLTSRWDPCAGAYDAERDIVLDATGAPYTAIVATEEKHRWGTHLHRWQELIWPITGTMQVVCAGRGIPLPRGLALCVPAGLPHSVVVSADATVGFRWTGRGAPRLAAATVVPMPAVLQETIWHLNGTVLGAQQRERASAFADDLLQRAVASSPSAAPVLVPMPRSGPLVALCHELVACPDDQRTLEAWACGLHLSTRTLAREFQRQLGTTFSAWRAEMRLASALPLLAAGKSVTETSHALGYTTVSAFTAAFRRRMGVTPGRYGELILAD